MEYLVTGSGSDLREAKLVVLIAAVEGSAFGSRLTELVLAAVLMQVRCVTCSNSRIQSEAAGASRGGTGRSAACGEEERHTAADGYCCLLLSAAAAEPQPP
jgi:hypothetical protein